MKKGNKKGLSTVVTTLIIVLLVIVAIGIIWAVIGNLIRTGSEEVNTGRISVSLDVRRVEADASGGVNVVVKRNIGEGDLQEVKVILSDGTNTQVVTKPLTLEELGEETIQISPSEITSISFVKEASVIPFVKGSSGKMLEAGQSQKTTSKLYDGLVAWYRFEDNAEDSVGSNDGTSGDGTVTYITSFNPSLGKAGSFNGASYFRIDDPVLGKSEMTVCAWARMTVPISNTRSILADFMGPENKRNYILGYQASSGTQISFYAGNGPSASSVAISGFTQNTWHFVCGLFKGNQEIRIYLDGSTNSVSTTFTNIGNAQSSQSEVGAYYTDRYFIGQIDNVMFYDRALSADEIKTLRCLGDPTAVGC